MIHSFNRALAALKTALSRFIDFHTGPEVFLAELEGVRRGVENYVKTKAAQEAEVAKEMDRSYDRQRAFRNAERALRDDLIDHAVELTADRAAAERIRAQIDKLLA